jgi:hypothetical protein
MKKIFGALGMVVIAGSVWAPSIASASPSGGTEHFHLTFTSQSGPGPIFASGAFNAAGTDYQGSKTDLAVFPDGAFSIHHPGGTFSFTLNPKTCVATLSGSGDYTINQGYGVYQGIKGSGSYTLTGKLALNRKANGTCGQQTVAEIEHIAAGGPVSFS